MWRCCFILKYLQRKCRTSKPKVFEKPVRVSSLSVRFRYFRASISEVSPQRTSTTMELLPLVCLCLLSCSGDAVRVLVRDGSDAVLPCLISNKDLEGKLFDWKKDGQKEVFTYDAGVHYNNGRPGQHEQFKGRVSHFQDQLQNGNASIKITRTKMADSGTYSCIFPRLQPSQTFIIQLVVDPRVEVFVKEDSDAFLPCSPNPKVDLTGQVFDWKKDGQKEKKEVFLYNSGGHTTQGPDFTDRVKHFQDQLKNGSASIKIHRVKKTDRGIYSCHFPHLEPSQTFYMKLVVGVSEPSVTIVRTGDGRMLQCKVRGASPKPKVEWQDSSGNVLPVKDLKEIESGGRYDIVLQAALTKTDTFACVVTQEKFSHQSYAEIDAAVTGSSTWLIAVVCVVVTIVAGGVLLLVLRATKRITLKCGHGSTSDTTY